MFFFVQQPLAVRQSSALLSLETRNKAGGLSLKPRLNGVNSQERAGRKRWGERETEKESRRGKECERKEGREGGKEGTRATVQDKQNYRERRVGEVCLESVPAGGMLSARPETASTGHRHSSQRAS